MQSTLQVVQVLKDAMPNRPTRADAYPDMNAVADALRAAASKLLEDSTARENAVRDLALAEAGEQQSQAAAERALSACDGDVQQAATLLMDGGAQTPGGAPPPAPSAAPAPLAAMSTSEW